MESTGVPGHIQVTERIYDIMKNDYLFEERGEIDVKGKGKMKTHFMLSRKNSTVAAMPLKSDESVSSLH
jgi:adenylate cyclase